MKTRISIFITAIVLLFGAITAGAQQTKAYFKKDGVTVFETPLSEIDSIVFKQEVEETLYLDVDWNTNILNSYNESTGEITIQHQDGTMLSYEKNRVIVLPDEYRCEIRVINSSSVLGNTATIQTKRGNICHLFKNTSFTLSTDPSLSSLKSSAPSKSLGRNEIITPSEIGIMIGKDYEVIYQKAAVLKTGASRAGTDASSFNIFSFDKDYTNMDIYNNSGHRLFWEKCSFDFGLNGVFTFDFGEKFDENNGKLPIGDLKKFEFYVDGNLNIDLLAKYIFTAQFKESKENLIKKNVLPVYVVKFVVGSVPVVIFIDTHLYNRYDIAANAEVTMSAGCNIQANAQMGFNYTRGVGMSPIMSYTPSFILYNPTFTAKGSLASKVSIYPRIEFEIYKCLAPWIEPMPYLREDFGAGMRASTDMNNYLGWASKSYAGLDCRMGLKMDFGILIPFVDLWTSDTYNPIDYMLLDAPKKIELVSPENGKILIDGEPIDVNFKVSSFNNIPLIQDYYPCSNALVNFETQGNVNKLFAVSAQDGLVEVQWIPKDDNDYLIAKIVDKDGQTISETTFEPEPNWVLINGVKWATRNVGEPGTFVENPEDAGMLYKWNTNTAYPPIGSVGGWANDPSPSDGWRAANDPCPSGFRVPNQSELQTLLSAIGDWKTINNVAGREFGAGENTIFLPAVGSRSPTDGALQLSGQCLYWSSSHHYLDPPVPSGVTSVGAWYLQSRENDTNDTFTNSSRKSTGMSVRCVKE